MVKLKVSSLAIIISFSLLLAGCGNDSQDNSNGEDGTGSIDEAVDYTITGIEPGAGMMGLTEDVLEEYDNLEGWELSESSTAGMLIELGEAIANEEPIIVTGWNPHWMFADYDLKYLEDPKNIYGDGEGIHTIVRNGLEEDMPDAYKILDRFNWETEDMETVMAEAQDSSFEEAAQHWVEENQDKVNEWTEGLEKTNGESIELISTQWDSELASGEVIKLVLEEQGYQVTVTPVDPAIMFQAIATGEGDATVAPWLPITHAAFYEQYEGDYVDLGANLEGAKSGLVVPEYMDIDSIEDLSPKN